MSRSGSIVRCSRRSDFQKTQITQCASFRTHPCCACCSLFPFNANDFQTLPAAPHDMDATWGAPVLLPALGGVPKTHSQLSGEFLKKSDSDLILLFGRRLRSEQWQIHSH